MATLLAAVVFFGTVLLGPGVFYYLSSKVKLTVKKYPVGMVDGVGDLLFLPFFNALAVTYGIDFTYSATALVPALVLALGYFFYRRDSIRTNDWSRPKLHHYNAGGWYHISYFFLQTFIIFLALVQHFTKLIFWVPIILYLLTAYWTYIYIMPRKKY